MANGHGGARAGSGRKRKNTISEQATRRDVLLDVVSPEEWREIVSHVVAQAKGGTLVAILPYLPYLLGSPKQDINVSGEVKATLTIADIRKAIRGEQ